MTLFDGGVEHRASHDILSWLHIGDLHVTHAMGENLANLKRIVTLANALPADLRQGGERIGALIARPHVACVDMGHTHYNELANDGRTVFMATRSTGQIEEGPVGFSIAALDHGQASWRFTTLDQAWPFVLITAPVDRRLRTGTGSRSGDTIRAKVFSSAPVRAVDCRCDDNDWHRMEKTEGQPGLFQAAWDGSGHTIEVRARTDDGQEDIDRVEPLRPDWAKPYRLADGSDKDNVGAWPDKGIFATQLGPNRNGRKW